MAFRRISTDLLLMWVAAIVFTLVGAVTGAFFLVVLCGSSLALTSIEVFATLRRSAVR